MKFTDVQCQFYGYQQFPVSYGNNQMKGFSAYALIAIVTINKRISNAQGIEKQPFAIIVSAAQIVKISSIAFIYYVHVMFSILCAHIHPDQNALVEITLKIAEQKISIK